MYELVLEKSEPQFSRTQADIFKLSVLSEHWPQTRE